MRGGSHCLPARVLRDEEDSLGGVLIPVFLEALAFGHQLLMFLLELVRDVLQEDEPQHDVLVLGGVYVAAQFIGGLPDLLLEAYLGGVVGLFLCHMGSLLVNLRVSPKLALGHNGLHGIGYALGRVLVLVQEAFDGAAHAGSGALLLLPVDGGVAAHRVG